MKMKLQKFPGLPAVVVNFSKWTEKQAMAGALVLGALSLAVAATYSRLGQVDGLRAGRRNDSQRV